MNSDPKDSAIRSDVEPTSIPTMEGKPIVPATSPVLKAATDGITPTAMDSFQDDHIEFATFAHQQVREYIQFADQKATFLFAASAAMLAFLHAQNAPAQWWKPLVQWNHFSILSFIALFGIAAAALMAAATIYPRTPGKSGGLLFWAAIAKRSSASDYIQDVRGSSKASLTESYLSHTHELSSVCAMKYAALRRAFRVAAVGFGAAVVYLLLKQAA